MRMKALILALIFASAAAAGCPKVFEKYETVFSKGQGTWVKLLPSSGDAGPFDHPVEYTAAEMEDVLLSLYYWKPNTFSVTGKEGDHYRLFTEDEASLIAPGLAEAFGKADPDQWVDFSVNSFRGQILIGSFVQTDGVMFYKDGKLNVAVRNFAVKADPENRNLSTTNPLRGGYRGFRHFYPVGDQEQIQGNWIAFDPARAAEYRSEAAAGEETVSNPPAEPERTAKERLQELQDLYDQGLISEEEYQKKRQEILDEL